MNEDRITVDNYIFWNFNQEYPHVVYFMYKKVIQNSDDNAESIRALFDKIGLWRRKHTA